MRTELYKDITTEKIMTFDDCKNEYAETNDSDLPIDDDTMYLIIMENLWQNGGNIELINDRNNSIMEWCNDYGDYNEADRFLSQFERDLSARNIYESIISKDSLADDISRWLADENNAESEELLYRMKKLLED